VIRVGAPRDMPVYFPAFAGTKLYCLVTEAVGCEQLAIETKEKWQLIIVSLTRSSATTNRPRDALCRR